MTAFFVVMAFLVAATAAGIARGDPMTGDVTAATSTPEGVRRNPANFAFMDYGFVAALPRIYEINQLSVHYVGSDPIVRETRGISPMSALSFAPANVDGEKQR